MTSEKPNNKEITPRLYTSLAGWFHLLTAPEDYKPEAEFYNRLLIRKSRIPVKTILELGSGGGNNASHMKSCFKLTLTDLSEDMLNLSRELNPECKHIRGDMRNLRLEGKFDAVFIHDAVSYIITLDDLKSTIETAFIHCKPGGAVLFAPDYVRENFKENTKHGGHDKGARGLRYLEWIYDPDITDTSYIMDFAYLLKDGAKTWCESDRHVMGLFSTREWINILKSAGFIEPEAVPFSIEGYDTPVFTAIKPD